MGKTQKRGRPFSQVTAEDTVKQLEEVARGASVASKQAEDQVIAVSSDLQACGGGGDGGGGGGEAEAQEDPDHDL
jgi:hypothetical protein|eukprot:COSAG06_NODE_15911_length_1035_cov_2.946581_1_plen_75_part_00